MATALENFSTLTHRDFIWPYPVPILVKPGQPPMSTGIRLYTPRINPEDCPCDDHGHRSNKNRYKYLAEKERQTLDQLIRVNREMTNLTTAMLDSNCEPMDDTMKTIYKTDYAKRGLPIEGYRQLKAAVDSPYCSPISEEVTELKEGHRDPTRFRYTAIQRPHIRPAKRIYLHEVPETFSLWEAPFTGRSEYMDTISKMGLSNIKNRQQYLEPQPSSRRRFGDCKLILQRDHLAERIEEGEIDPRIASIPSQLDEAAEQLVQKHILDRLRTAYQVSYKHPWVSGVVEADNGDKPKVKEKDLQSELLAHIHALYFNPHTEKILAPPPTHKRLLGYIRPKLLHASFSTYQDTFGRTGATVILKEQERKNINLEKTDTAEDSGIKKTDPCADFDV